MVTTKIYLRNIHVYSTVCTIHKEANQKLSIANLISEIQTNKVTITDFVPSIFNLLVEYLEVNTDQIERLNSLENIIIGGDVPGNVVPSQEKLYQKFKYSAQ